MFVFDMKKVDEDFLTLPPTCQKRIIDEMRTMHFVIESQKQKSSSKEIHPICVLKKEYSHER